VAMGNRVVLVVGVVIVICLALVGPVVATFSDDSTNELKTPLLDSASLSADHFLDRYVDPTGRVTSVAGSTNEASGELQAYGLLISAAVGDQEKFRSIWNWTSANLRSPDGSIATQWADGRIQSDIPDAPAGLYAARALSLAAEKFHDSTLDADLERLGKSMQKTYASIDASGKTSAALPSISASFFQPRAVARLASATDDQLWKTLAETSGRLLDGMVLIDGESLPSDWLAVDVAHSTALATNSPDGVGPRYSERAQMLVVQLGESCQSSDRDKAVRAWDILNENRDRRTATSLQLDGSIVDKKPSALASVASAAGAHSVRDDIQMGSMLDVADQIEAAAPTPADAAWAALGRIMLTTDWLGSC
jgi:endoglucanase